MHPPGLIRVNKIFFYYLFSWELKTWIKKKFRFPISNSHADTCLPTSVFLVSLITQYKFLLLFRIFLIVYCFYALLLKIFRINDMCNIYLLMYFTAYVNYASHVTFTDQRTDRAVQFFLAASSLHNKSTLIYLPTLLLLTWWQHYGFVFHDDFHAGEVQYR